MIDWKRTEIYEISFEKSKYGGGRRRTYLPRADKEFLDKVFTRSEVARIRKIRRLEGVEKSLLAMQCKKPSGDHIVELLNAVPELLKGGIPIVRALLSTSKQVSNMLLRFVVIDVADSIRAGSTITDAFRKHEEIFSPYFCNLIESGEEGGNLPKVFEKLADAYRREQSIRQKVRSVMIYPAIVIGIAYFAYLGFSFFIIPRLEDVFVKMGVEVPFVSRVVFNFAALTRQFWFLTPVPLIGAFFAIKNAKKIMNRKGVFEWIIRIPKFRDIIKHGNLTKLWTVFGILIESKVPITKALTISATSTGYKFYEDGIKRIEESVNRGRGVYASFSENDYIFAPKENTILSAIEVGEETGQLDSATAYISDMLIEEMNTMTERFKKILEPITTMVIVFIIGFFAFVIYYPIVSVGSAILGDVTGPR